MSLGTIVRDGTNTPRTITAIQVRDGTNTPRTISEVRVRDSNNVSRIVFQTVAPLTASAAPETVSAFGSLSTLTTNATTVTPVGGVAPYSYLWALDTYDGPAPPTVSSPTAATVTFTMTGLSLGETASAEWSCTVTDDVGSTAVANVFAFWSRN